MFGYKFCVTQILGQSKPAVGLFIAGILHRLLERAVLSTIELKHFFGKYRFVYIYCIDKIVSVLYRYILCRATYRRVV